MTPNINKSLTPPDVSRETMNIFRDYYQEIVRWNKSVSLMGDTDDFEIFYKRHIQDAIELYSYLETDIIIDIGSGGGVPAIPLGILGKQIILIESTSKKATFLRYCIKKYNINGICKQCRIEDQTFEDGATITARALADLKTLIRYIANVSRGTTGVFLKGEKIFQEIEEAEKEWLFQYELYSKIDNKGYIIVVRNMEKK